LTADLKKRMIYSVLLGMAYCVAGLWASYALDIASGASIVIISAACYFLLFAARAMAERIKNKKRRAQGGAGGEVRA
jgi:zinc transport system permease protein